MANKKFACPSLFGAA